MLRPRLLVALSVPFGFVTGHLVGFGLGHRDVGDGAAVEAGHEYLGSLTRVSLLLLVASLLVSLWSGARNRPIRPRYATAAGQLVGVFAVIEVIEHLALGWSLTHILTEPALWLGLLAQLVVAALVVAALRLFARIGTLIAVGVSEPPTRSAEAPAMRVLPLVAPVALTPITRRGPPVMPC